MLRLLRDSDEVFVARLAHDQVPQAVFLRHGVYHLAAANLVNKTVEQFRHGHKSIALSKDCFAKPSDLLVRDILLHGLDFAELITCSVLEVLLVKLEEGHDFVQVEAVVEVVVQGSSEVIDGQVAQTHTVAIAVVDEISCRVNLVPLNAVQEVFAQKSRIDW